MISIPPGLIIIAGAIILPLLPKKARSSAFLIFPLLAFVWLLQLAPGSTLTVPFLQYELIVTSVDKLSLAFGYVFVIIAFIGGFYGFHVKDTAEQVATLIYAGSSLVVVFAGDLITLLIFWEMMAWSSVYLIWGRRTEKARGAGMRYLLVHLFGGSVLLAGVLLHIHETGSIIFNHMDISLSSSLILFGFALNAAVPPLHAWLSDAYPEGTVTGSVFLSAFTTKTAIYALARGFAGWEVLMWAGAVMAVYGVAYAVLQNDIRRLLAYHIISQVGYMVCAVGIGTELAINGATAHAFAHILYKALLFMGTGTVLYATGHSKLSELGGLSRAMRYTLIFYMIGALSISGVPIFSGFVSKSVVIYAAEVSNQGIIVLLLYLASIGTFLSTALKLPYFTWFSKGKAVVNRPVPKGMYVGMGLASLACIAIGVYPGLLYNVLPFTLEYHPYSIQHLVQTFALLIATGAGFIVLFKMFKNEDVIVLDIDWFYRRPGAVVNKVFVQFPSAVFGSVEKAVLWVTYAAIRFSTNPVRYIMKPVSDGASNQYGVSQTKSYDPDRSRTLVGIMIVVLLIVFIVLLAWSLISV